VNQYGQSRKHIFDSVQQSLKRLQLEYIDVLQCSSRFSIIADTGAGGGPVLSSFFILNADVSLFFPYRPSV
jgi:hypothetical protein